MVKNRMINKQSRAIITAILMLSVLLTGGCQAQQGGTSPSTTPEVTSPSNTPTTKPANTPTTKPTSTPTAKPTSTPTAKPTSTPTAKPTSTPTTKPTSTPEASETKGLQVDGTKIKTADGTEFVMRGINHAHCWYQSEDTKAFDAIAATGANCIRIVLANGVQWNKDSKESVKKLIDAAKSRGMVAIVEVHDGTGSDDLAVLDKIVDFWIEMASVLKGTESYCIVNIANEWVGSWNADLWCKGYTSAIPKLRKAGIENLLMVDAAGWGQYGDSIKTKGTKVLAADPQKNTMFSIHMYGTAGGSEAVIKSNLEGATKNNLCICVGEFGYNHTDGDVKEDYIMKYCTEKNIGYIAWSWKGNSGGVEYLDLALDWEGKQLSADWGEKVVNGTYGIKATSKKILE